MSLFEFFKKLTNGYTKFTPAKKISYNYMSYLKCERENSIDIMNLPYPMRYARPVECWEIRPFAFIKGKKHRAKFKVVGNKCFIEIKGKKKGYELHNCSFAYKFKYFHHKKINPKKRKEKAFTLSPSGYGEYHVTVLVSERKDEKEKNSY